MLQNWFSTECIW